MLEANYAAAFNAGKIEEANAIRKTFAGVMKRALPDSDPKDTNFVFLWFVKENLPVGLIGLVFAIIFLAAWGSIAAALNSLAACTVVAAILPAGVLLMAVAAWAPVVSAMWSPVSPSSAFISSM